MTLNQTELKTLLRIADVANPLDLLEALTRHMNRRELRRLKKAEDSTIRAETEHRLTILSTICGLVQRYRLINLVKG